MAKIHTHYDNLKVARLAPQEVIRAAYKALSQKYHPDKNPGDEKAARIMAIVNTAYTTLNDPVRRKEHDEWIAAEEWEIAWLESTRHEDGAKPRGEAVPDWQAADPADPARPPRTLSSPRWWGAMLAFLLLGAAAGLVLANPARVMLLLGLAPQTHAKLALAPLPAPAAAPAPDAWAVARAYAPENGVQAPPKVAVLATAALVVPPRKPDCGNVLQTLAAPNGEAWPEVAGYVAGYPVANPGTQMQVAIDNSANNAPVFVKLYDLDRNANVRHAYLPAGASFTIADLAAGKYEVRYQDVVVGASRTDCAAAGARQTATPAMPAAALPGA